MKRGGETLQEVDYWLWFSLKDSISRKRQIALLQQIGSPEKLFHMDKKQMKKAGLSIKERITFADKGMEYPETVKERCKEVGIHILTYHNPAYPEKLKEISDPPCILYVRCKEKINLNDKICISMVGNRDMTKYGELAANEIAAGLAKVGIVVVSGMATGIDSASHIGALDAGGLTIAVLGCGADIVYPRHNNMLMNAIIEHGMVITEFPPGTPPLPKHFPIRNRIISGLSEGVAVIEAPIKSGSLITADLALKQNRDVFAVPGDINRFHSRGCNKLISKGAILINSAEDILKEYEFVFRNTLKQYSETHLQLETKRTEIKEILSVKNATPLMITNTYENLSEQQRKIIKNLSISPVSLETLLEKTKLSADELSAEIMMLEIEGYIKELPGKYFVLHT